MIGIIQSFIDETDSVGVDPFVGGRGHFDGLQRFGWHNLKKQD